MRNNPSFKKGDIHAKDAKIAWSDKEEKVIVTTLETSLRHLSDNMTFTGGACNKEWEETCKTEYGSMIACMRMYWNLTYIYEIDPGVVDEALSTIIEYQNAFRLPIGDGLS